MYEAVKRALWSNDVNKYILDEAFSPSSFHHPPTAMIIHYKVQMTETDELGTRSIIVPARSPAKESSITYHGEIFKKSLSDSAVRDTNENIVCNKESCTISIGWSSASVYTFIRPKFMLSLQPAWFLSSLNFSIHWHFGFPREITLHIGIQMVIFLSTHQ